MKSLLLALIACSWAMGANGIAQADRVLPPDQAKRILDRYFVLLSHAKTLHLVEEAKLAQGSYRSETWLIRFGPYRTVMTGTGPDGKRQEGSTYAEKSRTFMVDPGKKSYSIMKRFAGAPFINGLEPFCQKQRPRYTLKGKVIETTFQGKPVYEIETGEQSIPGSMVSVFVDRSTLIPVGWQYAVNGRAEQMAYTLFKLDEKMNPKDFVWTPPKGYKLEFDMTKLGPPG